jgi:hypothetical protein
MTQGLTTKQFIATIDDMLRRGGWRFRKRDYKSRRHQLNLDAKHVVVCDVLLAKSEPVVWMNVYMLCLERTCTSSPDSVELKAVDQWRREIQGPLLGGDVIVNCCHIGDWMSLVPKNFPTKGGQR